MLRRSYVKRLLQDATIGASNTSHSRRVVVLLEAWSMALTEEQHKGVIEQMNRMTTITTSKEVGL